MERRHLIEQFAMNIASLYRQTMKFRQSSGEGLSRPQLHALMLLKRETQTVKSLAKLMDTGSSAATQLVNHLAAAGWIERQADKYDARVTHLYLSEAGVARLREIKREHLGQLEKRFAVISDKELSSLVNISGKLTNNDVE